MTLIADPIDGLQISNIALDGGEVFVPGVPPYPEAYNGQFVEMDVVSVSPPTLPDAGVSCAVANGGCDPHATCTELDAGVVHCQCESPLVGDGCSCGSDAG